METITFQTNVKAIDFPIIEEILKRFKATDIRIIKEKKKMIQKWGRKSSLQK